MKYLLTVDSMYASKKKKNKHKQTNKQTKKLCSSVGHLDLDFVF